MSDLDAPHLPGGPLREDSPGVPPGEHDSHLPDESDAPAEDEREQQEENAHTSLDQPSQ